MPDENEIFLLVDDQPHGPFARADVVEGLTSGEIPPDTLAATSNDEEWRPISSMIQVAVSGKKESKMFTQTVKIDPPESSG